ncbi:MAG: hypothetical protein A4S17_03680 [Proteobacteria bacterium HN_bin10]|nr:MAG: hypothetical protein A4S17_03680 [Proteobacteria bacterium HN_bin10]
MPIVLRHNERLELNIAEYRGVVGAAALEALNAFLTANPAYLKRDCISVVAPGAVFAVDAQSLDRLFVRYAQIYATLSFPIQRRSAWVCRSPNAQPHVDHWVGAPNARDAISSTLTQFETLAGAGRWLALGDDDIAKLERGEGFAEVARFEDPNLSR